MQNDTFMKRYMLISKAKSAQVYGIIVVNSWAHKGGQKAVKLLRELLTKHNKKCYVFTMSKSQANLPDKLSEPKLKNFSEIDVYTVLSCPQSSFYDYRTFYKVQGEITHRLY